MIFYAIRKHVLSPYWKIQYILEKAMFIAASDMKEFKKVTKFKYFST